MKTLKVLLLASLTGYTALAYALSFENPSNNPANPGGCGAARYFEMGHGEDASWNVPELGNGQQVEVYSPDPYSWSNAYRSFSCTNGVIEGGLSHGVFEHV